MSGSAGLLNKKNKKIYLVRSPKVGGAGDGKHKKINTATLKVVFPMIVLISYPKLDLIESL